jgi:hypothetical protein
MKTQDGTSHTRHALILQLARSFVVFVSPSPGPWPAANLAKPASHRPTKQATSIRSAVWSLCTAHCVGTRRWSFNQRIQKGRDKIKLFNIRSYLASIQSHNFELLNFSYYHFWFLSPVHENHAHAVKARTVQTTRSTRTKYSGHRDQVCHTSIELLLLSLTCLRRSSPLSKLWTSARIFITCAYMRRFSIRCFSQRPTSSVVSSVSETHLFMSKWRLNKDIRKSRPPTPTNTKF